MATVPDTAVDPMLPVPFRVADRWDETGDTFTLRLDPPPGGFAFGPGQFNMLYVFGVGEVAISISGDPAATDRLIHTVRGIGSVTRALRKLGPGDSVGVRGPFGNSWPVDVAKGRDVVFVAGGIGLAAVRSAIYHVLSHREEYDRVVLLYGVRSPHDLLYLTVDNADLGWRGSAGVVTKLISRAPFDPSNAIVFVCGPEVMMRFTGRELVQRGAVASNIYVSMERNMKCAVGSCGHCQFGPRFVCKDGPVFPFREVADLLEMREL
jgi:NAD(P)H-flavin reductase